MANQINITTITGVPPYDIYICQVDGSNCIYIDTISSTPFSFIIPESYDITNGFTLKVIDANGCQILD
jgi:hypothetical protein